MAAVAAVDGGACDYDDGAAAAALCCLYHVCGE